MRRLFLKTFLWFWLMTILAVAALAVPNIYSSYVAQARWKAAAPALLRSASGRSVEALEESGEGALIQYLGELQRETSLEGFLFRDQKEVLATPLDPEFAIRKMARIASLIDGPQVSGTMAAQRVIGATGQRYAFVLVYRKHWTAAGVPLTLLLAGTLFCYLITRHVTAPLSSLRAAAASIAEGRLGTRIGPAFARRSDEIADLGRDFDRMAERIEALLAENKRLMGDASHELRSPLSRLALTINLAMRGPAERVPEHLERMKLETQRLDKIIGQLLTLSRIDSGVHADERISIDLGALVQDIASDADFEARSLSRSVVVNRIDSCTIVGSEDLLRSAVENVMRNAVRYTCQGTPAEVTLVRSDSKAVLQVRDHGTGVPEPMLTEMFLPFRRVPEVQPSGTGLGLAITERAVRAHGGAVRAMNLPEGGLLVEMEFPVV